MADAVRLILSNHIQGEWSAAVLLTYTANLSFFESQLLPQLSHVPVRVVLADAEQLRDTFERAKAAGEGLRRTNRTYIVGPIRSRFAAHAKAILLLGPARGWLAVGSGNLGLDGYASPGELWHTFAYEDARPEHLVEFETVRELIDGWLLAVDPPAREAVRRAWSTATWLGAQPPARGIVRHNLQRPVIEQLAEVVTSPVRTMRVHAPFYDRDLSGLATLLKGVVAERLEVLTTRDTSVDGSTLKAALDELRVPTAYQTLGLRDPSEAGTYLHAKWIHLLCDDKEVLLSGSANLSSPALVRSGAAANIELATLRTGGPGAFNRLYEPFVIEPLAKPSSLTFADTVPDRHGPVPDVPKLLWAAIMSRTLTLEFDRPSEHPDPSLRIVGIGGAVASPEVNWQDARVELRLTEDDLGRVHSGHLDVWLNEVHAGTVWPYRIDALNDQFATSSANDHLKRLRELPSSDADMMERLAALEQTLIIDFQSAWRISHPGKNLPEPDGQTDEPLLRLEDLDWARIRRSPQHLAYGSASSLAAPAPTSLQVALAAISGRLGELGQVATPTRSGLDDPEDPDAGLGAEPISEDESVDEEQPRRLPISTRTRMAWGRFIDRYVRAIGDDRFLAELGPHATIQNAAIFAGILTQLLREHEGGQRLVDPQRIVRSQVALWRHLWGDDNHPGLLDVDDQVVAAFIYRTVEETGLRASVLDAIEDDAFDALPGELRTQVRQQLNRVVSLPSFDLVATVDEVTKGQPAQVDACIAALVRLLAPRDDLEKAAHALSRPDLRASEVDWDTKALKRWDPRPGRSISATERVMVVHTAIPDLDHATMATYLAQLSAAERMTNTAGDYWRIHFRGNGKSRALWDARFRYGTTFLDGEEDDQEIDNLTHLWPEWWSEAQEIARAFGRRRTAG